MRLILIKKRDDLPHHHLSWIVAQFLSDGEQSHICLGKSADVHFEAKTIAEKPRIGVHDDDVERSIVVRCVRSYAGIRAAIIGRGRTRFDIVEATDQVEEQLAA